MVEIRYADLVTDTGPHEITTMGSVPGPIGADGWTQFATLPAARMAGTSSYVVMVRGKIGNVQVAGSGQLRGLVQLCLGTTAGLRHPNFQCALPVTDQLPFGEGVPFEFLVMIDAAFSDALFGSSFDPSGSQLCLYARTFWNGDPQTYAVTFHVGDVNWLWFDTGEIPAGHWIGDRVIEAANGTPLPTTNPTTTFNRLVPTAIGDAGQTWLCFANAWYGVRQQTGQAPSFRFGATPDGTAGAFVSRIGAGGRWGTRRCWGPGSVGTFPDVQMGGFFVLQPVNATTQAGYFAWEPAAVTNRSLLRRFSFFAVRIDTLPDVRVLSHTTPQQIGVSLANPEWPLTNVVIERPAPTPGILTEPIVMMHGVVAPLARTGYDAFAQEYAGGQPFGLASLFSQSDPGLGEGVSSMNFGRRIFQTTSPAMQWLATFIGWPATAAPTTVPVHDFCFVQWHPVRDPENLTDPPGTTPPPIVVVPGKQAPEAASLAAPPHQPNANPQQRGTDGREQIVGATGYRRSWPLGARVLREYSLTWGPLAAADAREVYDFLVANAAWRYTPPRGAAVAVLNMRQPQLQPTGHRIATVSIDVAVLAFTGT